MKLNLEFVIDEMNSYVGQSVSVFIELLFFGSKTIQMEIDHASIEIKLPNSEMRSLAMASGPRVLYEQRQNQNRSTRPPGDQSFSYTYKYMGAPAHNILYIFF